MLLRIFITAIAICALAQAAPALPQAQQQAATRPSSSPVLKSVPRLINFPGRIVDSSAKPVPGPATVVFAIYKDEEGGEPLWRETQNVTADAEGNYTAPLGVTEPAGIPLELFSQGESRWLGVSVNGANERPRALLLSVPYALKAADAETVGGLPASAFVRADLGNPASFSAVNPAPAASPKVTANQAITGLGAIGNIPLWDSTSDLVNSNLFQNGANLGIGTKTASALLDVNGTATVRDSVTLVPKGTDPALTVRNTLFQIASTGLVTFDTGQTFPGVGTIKGINTLAGSGLAGGGTSGTLTLGVAPAGITNNMIEHPGITLPVSAPLSGGGAISLGATAPTLTLVPCPAGEVLISNGTSWSCTAAAGTGKVTNVALSAPATDFTVTGSPITGAGTLALNWNVAPTPANVANAIVKRDATGSIAAGAIFSQVSQGVGVYGESDGQVSGSNGVQGDSTGPGGSGVAGFNTAGGIGVYGQGGTGVYGFGTDYGFATNANVQQARTAGGWVKAMVWVDGYQAPYSIKRCFNSTLSGSAATTVPCGISLTEYAPGVFSLGFNFEVDDRFYSSVFTQGGATTMSVYSLSANELETVTSSGEDFVPASYSLIVF
jgi:hypothetical protein